MCRGTRPSMNLSLRTATERCLSTGGGQRRVAGQDQAAPPESPTHLVHANRRVGRAFEGDRTSALLPREIAAASCGDGSAEARAGQRRALVVVPTHVVDTRDRWDPPFQRRVGAMVIVVVQPLRKRDAALLVGAVEPCVGPLA